MPKRYYWLKLKENFFDDDTIRYVEEQENGIVYSNFYLKLCLKSIKYDGKLIRLIGNRFIPYDIPSLAKLTDVPVDTVAVAMKLFEKIGLVERLESGEIYLAQINEMIGSETNKAELMRRKRAEEKLLGNNVTTEGNIVTAMLPERYPEIRDKSSENREQSIDTSSNEEVCKSPGSVRATIPYRQIQEMFNSICAHFPKCQALSDRRKKAIKARFENGMTVDDFKKLFEKAEASSFLRGKNDRDWQASFDWLIKDANMVKVLDGNYDNRGGNDYGRNVGAQAAGRNPIGRFEEIPGGVQL